MPDARHPLDRPVWGSLAGAWRAKAVQAGEALRLEPAYGPFAASVSLTPDSLADLAVFQLGEDSLDLIEPEPIPAPAGLAITLQTKLVQMTADASAGEPPDVRAVALDESDGPEMLALAQLTRPGPFAPRTPALGGFIGVKVDGRLIAMAGERMRVRGFCEVSGVCTHPEHRGRGHAGALMRLVARRILARGETPFLHAMETNAGAIALYGKLGFRIRRKLVLTVLKRA